MKLTPTHTAALEAAILAAMRNEDYVNPGAETYTWHPFEDADAPLKIGLRVVPVDKDHLVVEARVIHLETSGELIIQMRFTNGCVGCIEYFNSFYTATPWLSTAAQVLYRETIREAAFPEFEVAVAEFVDSVVMTARETWQLGRKVG